MLRLKNTVLLGLAALGVTGGVVAALLQAHQAAAIIWLAATAVVLVALAVQIVIDLRRGAIGIDLLAALAMAGAIVLRQPLAGAVIALMFASGGALEEYAQARSRRELSALLGRAPRLAHRLSGDQLADIATADIARDDRLLVKAGEVVPADGILAGAGVIDESALTGEPLPVGRPAGDQVRSGVVNAGNPFEMIALANAADSTYAAIIRLVEGAERSKAPFVRMADRFALLFIPFTLAVAGLAWLVSGESIRVLAVLVVATPCPLILAAPVALVSGISRAARRGILIKTAAALETLARARVLLLDKTGTLTGGVARLVGIEADDGFTPADLLRLAASLDQASQHVMAAALVAAARSRGLPLSLPSAVREQPGAGIVGMVDGCQVAAGSFEWIRSVATVTPFGVHLLKRMSRQGNAGVFVAVNGRLVGALLLTDEVRADTPAALRLLRKAGITKVIMVSGDRADVAETIAAALGIDAVLAERSPSDKVSAVLSERGGGVTVMVGDGINDAPALAAADVGVALGARGAAASSEAADVVLLVDRLDRLAEAFAIARRSRTIALESVIAGMALSVVAMAAAAAGWLPPVAGALAQEAIDVAVILNALRALGPASPWSRAPSMAADTVRQLTAEHAQLISVLDRIQAVADQLDILPAAAACRELSEIDRLLQETLLPHEREDEGTLYPRLVDLLGGQDPMAAMSRTHREILHLTRLFARMTADLAPESLAAEDRRDARRILYGLGAILKLHFAQEDELFHLLVSPGGGGET